MDFTGFQGLRPSYYEPDRRGTQLENRLKNLEKSSESLPAGKELKELDAVCRDLESLFIYLLMKEMRKTVPETKLIHGGRGEEIFRDMLDEEMSKKLAASPQGIGIAKVVYEQLSRPALAKLRAEQQALNPQNTEGAAISEPEKK